MKLRLAWVFVLATVLAAFQLSAAEDETKKTADKEKPALETQMQKVSYGIGVNIANSFRAQGVDIDVDMLMRAINDVLSGNDLLMTDDEIHGALMDFQAELQKKQETKMKEEAEVNKKAGEDYLAKNKKEEGVVTLDSGLQYKILKEGDGKKPGKNDTVEVDYRGMLIDGTEFDSSYARGEPAQFRVDGVIKGWTEALQLMPVGSKWKLFIPSDLAYGDRGAGPIIAPGSTLIFDVELLSIK